MLEIEYHLGWIGFYVMVIGRGISQKPTSRIFPTCTQIIVQFYSKQCRLFRVGLEDDPFAF